jgi:putative oxidoreductase
LGGRVLLVLVFLVFGYAKLRGYSGTVAYMTHVRAPWPQGAALVSVVVELGFSIALILGAFTRPVALLLAVYTLGTGFIAHHFWTMTGMDRYLNEINFLKNISIIGGLVLLAAIGPGRYSIDALLRRPRGKVLENDPAPFTPRTP